MPSEEQVDQYLVDHKFSERRVRHLSPGPTVPGCQGIWKGVRTLVSEYGDSFVEVQRLERAYESPRGSDGESADGGARGSTRREPPAILRAVKRLRTQQTYPAVDQRQMIRRGLLCMARANVSCCCILSVRARGAQQTVQGFRHSRGCANVMLVRRRHVHLYRDGVLRVWQLEGLDYRLSAPRRIVGPRSYETGFERSCHVRSFITLSASQYQAIGQPDSRSPRAPAHF